MKIRSSKLPHARLHDFKRFRIDLKMARVFKAWQDHFYNRQEQYRAYAAVKQRYDMRVR